MTSRNLFRTRKPSERHLYLRVLGHTLTFWGYTRYSNCDVQISGHLNEFNQNRHLETKMPKHGCDAATKSIISAGHIEVGMQWLGDCGSLSYCIAEIEQLLDMEWSGLEELRKYLMDQVKINRQSVMTKLRLLTGIVAAFEACIIRLGGDRALTPDRATLLSRLKNVLRVGTEIIIDLGLSIEMPKAAQRRRSSVKPRSRGLLLDRMSTGDTDSGVPWLF